MKKIYLLNFKKNQVNLFKKKFSKCKFIDQKKVSNIINDCDAVLAPTRDTILDALNNLDFKNKNLKWIHLPGSGAEEYINFFKNKNVTFTSGKKIQNHQVSDHAIGLYLCLTRKINYNLRFGQKVKFDQRPIELNKKIALIFGFGGNGQMIAKKLLSFNMKIISIDIKKKIKKNLTSYKFKNFDKSFSKADVIFLTCPLSKETKNIINSRTIKKMKRGSILINVARAGLVDQSSVLKAVKSGYLAGAGLDVTEGEPLNEKHPLLKTQNIIVTPHTAGISDNSLERSLELYIENIKRFLKGKKLINRIDKIRGF